MASLSLYQSDWSPPGVRKDWDRCSMGIAGAARFIGRWGDMGKGQMQECVAWFAPDGSCRQLVADYDSGRRLWLRFKARSTKAQVLHVPPPQAPESATPPLACKLMETN